MITKQRSGRREVAATELQAHGIGRHARQAVDSLSVGLTHLRDLLMVRAHDDVQQAYGVDTSLATSLSSMQRQTRHAKFEIEAYSCIVAAEEIAQQDHGDITDAWILDWLCGLRLGSGYESIFKKRVEHYRSGSIEERRLKFVSILQEVMPESKRAPLVLFRLFPRSVRIMAAIAFGDAIRAELLRDEQTGLLPAISDCRECHGRVLENDEICRCCGNPLWHFTWLLSD